MRIEKSKIVVVLGPTASGKSDLAVKLAQKFNGEVISADSRQVYRGLNLGSGKVPRDKKPPIGYSLVANYYYKGIRHHLLDIASPRRTFTVEQYKKLAKKALKKIFKRSKLPIICGGTGLYIDALVYNISFPKVPPNQALRKKLEKLTNAELFKELKRLDQKTAKRIDRHNKRRLIRALEIIKKTGKPIPPLRRESPYNALKIGIKKERAELAKKITHRLEERLKKGMVREVARLHAKGVSFRRLDDFGLEYRYVSRYLRGLMDYKTMKESIVKESLNYAKRQMVWFTRDKSIHWISKPKIAFKLVKQHIRKKVGARSSANH